MHGREHIAVSSYSNHVVFLIMGRNFPKGQCFSVQTNAECMVFFLPTLSLSLNCMDNVHMIRMTRQEYELFQEDFFQLAYV